MLQLLEFWFLEVLYEAFQTGRLNDFHPFSFYFISHLMIHTKYVRSGIFWQVIQESHLHCVFKLPFMNLFPVLSSM